MSNTKKTSAHKTKTPVNQPITTDFCTKIKQTQRSESRDQRASLEAQIVALEEQIAELSAESRDQSAERREQSAERRMQSKDGNQNHSAFCALNSALPRAQLPTPVLGAVLADSNTIIVTWNPVANSQEMWVMYSKNPDFDPISVVGVSGSLNSATLTGLEPNTLYYIRLKATGTGTFTDSGYSNVKTITTLRDATAGAGNDTASQLQAWLAEMQSVTQSFFTLLPQLETTELNSRARMRLNGSGVRRYGFIEKTLDVSGEFPQFWPAFSGGREALAGMVGEIEVLRNLLVWLRWAARVVQDLLLIAGDDAFRLAGSYYAVARDGARRMNPEAQQVFHMLQLFWHRRRNPTEPTLPEVERDVRALLRGTKDGSVLIENESDSVVKGKKVIVDETRRKPRGGVKVIERGEVVLSADSADVR